MNNILDKTKKLLGVSMAGMAALPMVTSCDEAQEQQKPMNVLFIMCDDHSYQTISAYDSTFIKTPNIDRIAADGVRFTNSFVANSISGPSRACMLTGKHSLANGFTDNSSSFDGSQQTFPKLLQQQGYETAVIGKWHLTSEPTGFNHWDILIGQGDYYNPTFICNGERCSARVMLRTSRQTLLLNGLRTVVILQSLSACFCTTRPPIAHGCLILVI